MVYIVEQTKLLTLPQSTLIICMQWWTGRGRLVGRRGPSLPTRICYALPSLIFKRDKRDDWGQVRQSYIMQLFSGLKAKTLKPDFKILNYRIHSPTK